MKNIYVFLDVQQKTRQSSVRIIFRGSFNYGYSYSCTFCFTSSSLSSFWVNKKTKDDVLRCIEKKNVNSAFKTGISTQKSIV